MKEPLKIVASDRTILSATRFIPKKPNGRIVLINSATGVKQRFYYEFAAFLESEGFHVYTYDYRGIGGSRPDSMRGSQTSMIDWGALDYCTMLEHILHTHPQLRVVVVGHSVGGQLVGLSSLTAKVDTLVMVGAQTPYWRNYPGFRLKSKLVLLWYVMIPILSRVFGYFPASNLGLFEDLPRNAALQWARWAKTPNYLFDEFPEAEKKFSSLQQLSLMISFSDDNLAPDRAVKDLMSRYPQLKWSHWKLKPDDVMLSRIGHFGFFKRSMQPTLWQETVKWINKPFNLNANQAA